MATTARDIIVRALEDVGVIGVGQTPLGEDINFGLDRLNAMIGIYNRRRWMIFHTKDVVAVTNGSMVYTVGLGGDFDVARPDKLEDGCFFRQFGGAGDFNNDFNDDFSTTSDGSNPVDYPLTLLEAREDWNRIALKHQGSWPSFIYYDPAATLHTPNGATPGSDPKFPCGNLLINPVPPATAFQIHILVKDVLQTLTNPSTVLLTPPEYEESFEYNLALRFAAKYQVEASQEVIGLARAADATIRAANTQVPLASLPSALIGRGRRYNIYNDRSN